MGCLVLGILGYALVAAVVATDGRHRGGIGSRFTAHLTSGKREAVAGPSTRQGVKVIGGLSGGVGPGAGINLADLGEGKILSHKVNHGGKFGENDPGKTSENGGFIGGFGGGPLAGGGVLGSHTVIDGGFINELDDELDIGDASGSPHSFAANAEHGTALSQSAGEAAHGTGIGQSFGLTHGSGFRQSIGTPSKGMKGVNNGGLRHLPITVDVGDQDSSVKLTQSIGPASTVEAHVRQPGVDIQSLAGLKNPLISGDNIDQFLGIGTSAALKQSQVADAYAKLRLRHLLANRFRAAKLREARLSQILHGGIGGNAYGFGGSGLGKALGGGGLGQALGGGGLGQTLGGGGLGQTLGGGGLGQALGGGGLGKDLGGGGLGQTLYGGGLGQTLGGVGLGQALGGTGLEQALGGSGLGQTQHGGELRQALGGGGLGQSLHGGGLGQSLHGGGFGQALGGSGLGQTLHGGGLGQTLGGIGLGQTLRGGGELGHTLHGGGLGQALGGAVSGQFFGGATGVRNHGGDLQQSVGDIFGRGKLTGPRTGKKSGISIVIGKGHHLHSSKGKEAVGPLFNREKEF